MEYKLGVVETHFAELVWQREPLSSGELVKPCEKELGWKKSTTYTVLKKLCEKGLFENKDSTVRALMSREDYQSAQSRQFVEESFNGSLPAFLSAFSGGRKLSKEEAQEIRDLIDAWADTK